MVKEVNMFTWPYFRLLRDGFLYDEESETIMKSWPRFSSIEEAEAWLTEQNIRGTVIGTEQPALKNRVIL